MPDDLFDEANDPLLKLRAAAGRPEINKIPKAVPPVEAKSSPIETPVVDEQPEQASPASETPLPQEAPSEGVSLKDMAKRALDKLPDKPAEQTQKEQEEVSPDSAAARYEKAMQESVLEPVARALKRKKEESTPVAILYEKAAECAPELSPPSFKEWALKVDEGTLSTMDSRVQDFLRVVRGDPGFPEASQPGPIVVHLQSLRVNRRVIDTAVETFKTYQRELRSMGFDVRTARG